MRLALLLPACLLFTQATAQHYRDPRHRGQHPYQDMQPEQAAPDTTALGEVTVSAFGANASRQNVAAAVSVVDSTQLRRGNTTSIVQAVNETPGVRMEERSPGSFRLSLRGSTLRAPFGVRNVKVYYDDLPLTDPGGFTYLNALGYYNISRLEILKGPGSSLYGSGTGGVMLISSSDFSAPENSLTLRYAGGSYGLSQASAQLHTAAEHMQTNLSYQHQQSDGYRKQSAMQQDVLSWHATSAVSSKTSVSATLLFNHLHYQTPGALTLAEYEADPTQARPRAGATFGASFYKAAIFQDNLLAGFTVKHAISAALSNQTTGYGAISRLINPNIRNYSRTGEAHFGGRTTFAYEKQWSESALLVLAGGEAQQYINETLVYKNTYGYADSLRSNDEVTTIGYFGFLQAQYRWRQWSLTAGASINKTAVTVNRFTDPPAIEYKRKFRNELAPRIALLYAVTPKISVYGVVSKGFSPPTTEELSPSGGELNLDLKAETAWSYELGLRGFAADKRLSFDLNVFYLALSNAIVLRRDSLGGDYYLNAGGTKQMGAELALGYALTPPDEWPLSVWASYTYYHFRYRDFIQYTADYSGNQVPGVAPHNIAAGVDAATDFGLGLHLTVNYLDKLQLDDANTAATPAATIFGARLNYEHSFINRYRLEAFAGVDNIGDQVYSPGPDINAFGGRYYNAALGRNIYLGLNVGMRFGKKGE